jgi:hypothetical protein
VKPQLPATGAAYDLARRINRDVAAKLAAEKIAASPISGDAEFIRRVHLDLVGRIPARDRVVTFLESADPQKRVNLVDELLASPDFGRHLARIWADALIKRDFDNNKNLRPDAFVAWLAGQINKGVGWDRIVTEMITATGSESSVPQTFFVLANQDNRQPSPSKLTGSVGNLFMGVQIQCAECHRHPATKEWGMDDFWGVAAFFGHTKAERPGGDKNKKGNGPATIREAEGAAKAAKAGKKGGPAQPSGLVINVPDPNDPRKVVRTARGKFFASDKPVPAGGKGPYRPHLAEWLTAKDNPYFARATANRVWAHFFARGLVNPLEDMNPENKPTHPELLTALAEALVEAKYDLKELARAICNSEPYQRTSRPTAGNQNDDKWYSRAPVKVMEARVLLDSLAVATGRQRDGSRAAGKQAERSPAGTGGDATVRFFDTREYDDDPTEYSYGIPQILRMMNTSLTASSAAIAARLASKHNDDAAKVLEEIYLLALSRKPTEREVERLTKYVSRHQDPAKGYAGVLWALLNSAEFVSNH